MRYLLVVAVCIVLMLWNLTPLSALLLGWCVFCGLAGHKFDAS